MTTGGNSRHDCAVGSNMNSTLLLRCKLHAQSLVLGCAKTFRNIDGQHTRRHVVRVFAQAGTNEYSSTLSLHGSLHKQCRLDQPQPSCMGHTMVANAATKALHMCLQVQIQVGSEAGWPAVCRFLRDASRAPFSASISATRSSTSLSARKRILGCLSTVSMTASCRHTKRGCQLKLWHIKAAQLLKT